MDKKILLTICLFCILTPATLGRQWKERPEEDEEPLEPIEDPVPAFTTARPLKDPFADLYRCDNLHGLKKNAVEFANCCRSFPIGTFVCPRFAHHTHICRVSFPPNCCNNCPPMPSTIRTTPRTPVMEDIEASDEYKDDD